jgi:hypothetical protein
MVSIIYVLDYYYYRPDGEKIFTSGFFIQTKNGELDFVCCVIKTGAVWCANSASPLLPFLDTLN